MSTAAYLPQFYIKVNGSLVSTDLMDDLVEIEVEDNLHLPDMFAIHLHDRDKKWSQSKLFEVGKEVEISVQAPRPQSTRLGPRTILMQGEVTGLEPNMSDDGVPNLVIRGFDRAHRLHQGRQTRSFLQSRDDEIAQRIATEVGLNADVQPTGTIQEHITQNNQTNMEFLMERARRLGYQLCVEDETLYFGPPKPEQIEAPQLIWGENLLDFRPVLTSVHQVDAVVVRGWDPMTKREIVGRASESTSMPGVEGTQKVQSGFKGSNQMIVSRPVQTQAEADAVAQSIRDEMAGDLVQAEGNCIGNPNVKAGQKIEIEGHSSQFDGQYTVTKAIHTYQDEAGYETLFSIGGRKPDTLSALLGEKADENDRGRGVMIGIVTNNKDPEGLGRIKVKYPSLDDIDESPWIRIAAPMAGEQRGFYCLPEINDEVLVAFEQGDIHRPYMLGVLWNGPDKPPRPNNSIVGSDGKVNKRIIRSRSGHEIILDDTDGQEKITIVAKGDLIIEATGKIIIKGASIDLN